MKARWLIAGKWLYYLLATFVLITADSDALWDANPLLMGFTVGAFAMWTAQLLFDSRITEARAKRKEAAA